jgi:hypothetical protein
MDPPKEGSKLLSKIINEPNIIHVLHEQFRKHGVWVSDQEFAAAVETKSAYRSRDLPFARMLLIEVDKTFQTFGQFPDYSTVPTIEHVLPQELTNEWRTYLGLDAEDEHLPELIHTIGNLCLLSQPANSSAGQNPFTAKTDCYSEVTALARQIKNHQEPWNLAAIRCRSKLLAKSAVGRWAWSS